ncbi:MAG: anti-sigma F factor antagonist [Bacilli bacterium]
MTLTIEQVERGSVLVIRLSGELDQHVAVQTRERLDQAMHETLATHLIINFQDVTFMDSSGLSVVIGRYKYVRSLGGQLFICGLSQQLKRLFELSGMFKIVVHTTDEHDAYKRLGVA